ncbi:hypothetical protein [Streptomyces sp. NPDC051561]|uniref:hypothetical protein n=1 Tax=Streptomyces sp. NPDC051561 TaxID=3365658 RepID=UPI00379E5F56
MTGALSEDEIRAAVQRKLGPGTLLGEPRIVEMHRSRCKVVRLIETRTSKEFRENGEPPKRLDTWEKYDDLHAVPLPPPHGVTGEPRRKLLLRGSVHNTPCGCDDGLVDCPDCTNGQAVCAKDHPCKKCDDTTDACVRCGGIRAGRNWAPPQPAPDARQDAQRVRCRRCHAPRAACTGCAGMGRTECTKCHGSGTRRCESCNAKGTAKCGKCKGKGSNSVWTEGWITRVPTDQPPEELPHAHPPGTRRQIVNDGKWSFVVLRNADEPFPDMLDESHRSALDRFRLPRKPTKEEAELNREVRFEQLPVYRATFVQKPNREYYVFPAHDGVRAVSAVAPHMRRLLSWSAFVSAMLVIAALVLILR